jgi:hypothetical protein
MRGLYALQLCKDSGASSHGRRSLAGKHAATKIYHPAYFLNFLQTETMASEFIFRADQRMTLAQIDGDLRP